MMGAGLGRYSGVLAGRCLARLEDAALDVDSLDAVAKHLRDAATALTRQERRDRSLRTRNDACKLSLGQVGCEDRRYLILWGHWVHSLILITFAFSCKRFFNSDALLFQHQPDMLMIYACSMKNLDNLADRLAWSRKRMGISQQQLADLCGMAQSTIGSLEAGTRFSARKVSVIADALGVDALWLAEGKGLQPGDGPPVTVRPVMAGQRPARMQWVSDEEAQLLSLYRSAADERGRELIRLTADSVPKSSVTGVASN